ncbi:MAG: LptE family protein [Deltaproteobacteria bacterium]|nr:LptE family protein [Deltaproteobacteria bacterium]
MGCFFRARFWWVLPLFCLVGCGYHLQPAQRSLPRGIKRVAVPVFDNNTLAAGLELDYTNALIRELAKSHWVEIAASSEDAEGILEGKLVSLSKTGAGHGIYRNNNEKELVSEYLVELTVQLKLRDVKTREILWENEVNQPARYLATDQPLRNDSLQRLALRQLANSVMEKMREALFSQF